MLRPNALSFKLTVCRLGSVRRDVRSDDRAVGISLSSRPVNISARFAIYRLAISSEQSDGCKPRNLWRGNLTLRLFLVSSTSPISLQASMPSVLPNSLTSSISSISRSDLMCGSTSAAVSSFNPLPSKEKTFVDSAMVVISGLEVINRDS
jgi:hypothetical protein